MSDDEKDDQIEPKDEAWRHIRYMARYIGEKQQICQIKGQKMMEIYEGRGFVEVDKEEFMRIWEKKRKEFNNE